MSTPETSMRGKWPWLGLALAVLALDQITKYWAHSRLMLHESIEVLPVFSITLAYNTGAAFSFLADAGGWQRWFLTLLAVGVSAVVVFWMAQARKAERGWLLCLSLILGGALGNALDRALHGFVVDFLDLHYAGWHWPTFNVADMAIVLGAVLFVWFSLTTRDPAR